MGSSSCPKDCSKWQHCWYQDHEFSLQCMSVIINQIAVYLLECPCYYLLSSFKAIGKYRKSLQQMKTFSSLAMPLVYTQVSKNVYPQTPCVYFSKHIQIHNVSIFSGGGYRRVQLLPLPNHCNAIHGTICEWNWSYSKHAITSILSLLFHFPHGLAKGKSTVWFLIGRWRY